MTRYWNQLEGVSLAGRYWLKQCLTSTPEDAWYLTRYDVNTDAAVRVMPANAPDAEEQLAMWRRAMDFDHPHIVRMLDAGRTEAEGADLIYAVCEYPDEFVAGVLTERALSPAETREVLNASLAALGFLHENGLAHGAADAAHIMAFGDTIKLACDTIRPEGAGVSAADDMWSLGATLHQVLTREAADVDGGTDFGHLPEPFATIVRNTLRQNAAERWGVGEIERWLNPPLPAPVIEPAAEDRPAVEAPKVAVEAPKTAVEAAGGRQDARPVVEAPKIRVISESLPFEGDRRPHRPAAAQRGFPMKWVPIAGLVAAVALSAVIFRKPAHEATPSVVAKARPAQSADRVSAPPPRVETPAPTVAHDPSAIWRVVAYTYNSRGAAEKKARSINERRSAWRAEVFTPRGERPPYYVALGGRMTLAQAERLQKEARSKGLPQDTFVRNFRN